ncbi:MAG: protein kinase [Myxococcales bacterium]|nr:protein kinase [Myxococcales bacterium]
MLRGESLDPRIRIRAPLRCDGIGRLDCAEDAESGGRMAVRWLPLDANGDAAVKACAKLPEHPRLPRIRQTGQVGSSAFVAMDFPEGALLSTRVGERLEVDEVIRLGSQLACALATVHAQGVVHGEMSCDSVLLVAPDHAYLWDMPLVIANRLTDRRGENRLMQNLVKTAPFLAPERARGEGASQASDVYALGAVLCVAAGAPLPVASTTLGVVNQVATGAWTPRVPMVLPEPYRSTLALMVSEDPSARPPADEVAAIFAELPPAASLPTVPEFPVVKLPPELLAAADALLRRPSAETPAVPSEPFRSREAPLLAEAKADDAAEADTVKRAAVVRPEDTASDGAKAEAGATTEQSSRAADATKAKASASAPSAADSPVARPKSGTSEQAVAEQLSAPEKTGTSGPTPAQVVAEKLSAPGKTGTSGPMLAQAVAEQPSAPEKSGTAGPTPAQAVAEQPSAPGKTGTSGPTLAQAVAEKLSAPGKTGTSGPPLAQAVAEKLSAAGKAGTSGPTPAQAVAEKLSASGKAGTSGPTLAQAVAEKLNPASAPAVQMTDTISVSHELHQAGAVTLSADEVQAIVRSRRQVIVVAAGLGGAILALMLVVFLLAQSRGEPQAAPPPRPAVVAPSAPARPVVPKARPSLLDDELAPLPQLPLFPSRPAAKPSPKAVARPARPAPEPAAAPVQLAAPSETSETSETSQVVTPDPTDAQDFSFLDSSAEAPTSELKRPRM